MNNFRKRVFSWFAVLAVCVITSPHFSQPGEIRIFSSQNVNEPGERRRMVFVRANAPVLVLT